MIVNLYLDLTFIINDNCRPYTKLNDKCNDSNFHFVNFQFLSSNMSSGLQMAFTYRICKMLYIYKDDFGYHQKLQVDRFLSYSYKVNRLRISFKTFCCKYINLFAKYQKSVRNLLNDSFFFILMM